MSLEHIFYLCPFASRNLRAQGGSPGWPSSPTKSNRTFRGLDLEPVVGEGSLLEWFSPRVKQKSWCSRGSAGPTFVGLVATEFPLWGLFHRKENRTFLKMA